MLADALRVLTWHADEQEELERAESGWVSHVARGLGSALGDLEQDEPERADHVLELLGRADETTLRRILLAPETSSRVLFDHPGRCDERDVWTYLIDALDVSLADGPGNGRTEITPPTVVGLLVDTDSPAVTCFDTSTVGPSNAGPRAMALRHYTDAPTRSAVITKVERAMRALDGTNAEAAAFARRFTVVLHLVIDANSTTFSSGSVGDYVGRSIFCNAHLPTVGTAILAESLVHEAIHSLLSMYEADEPWFLDAESFSPDSAVASPWTGARLSLRTFLQACFVWYGLAHFWIIARRSSLFPPDQVESRVFLARRGFLEEPLVAHLGDLRSFVAPSVLELVAAMQKRAIALTPSG